MKSSLPRLVIMSSLVLSSFSLWASARPQPRTQPPTQADAGATAEAARDPIYAELAARLPMLDEKTRRGVAMQVALDRAGFSPGEIDGAPGTNTDRAMTAFKAARGTSDLGEQYSNPVTTYIITPQDVAGPFVERIPDDMMAKSKLESLAYTSVLELLAERFHVSPELLRRLNPVATFSASESVVVPNVEPLLIATLKQPRDRAATPRAIPSPARKPADRPQADKGHGHQPTSAPVGDVVVVTDRTKTLQVEDAAGSIIFHAPVTTGSKNDPLPIGEWKVMGVSREPVFHYNPQLFWDADPSHAKATIAPGPNNPVGLVWIDLDKEHYGIHGTPEPSRIGYTESHGCIRLTNWDVVRLAGLVSPGTRVVLR